MVASLCIVYTWAVAGDLLMDVATYLLILQVQYSKHQFKHLHDFQYFHISYKTVRREIQK